MSSVFVRCTHLLKHAGMQENRQVLIVASECTFPWFNNVVDRLTELSLVICILRPGRECFEAVDPGVGFRLHFFMTWINLTFPRPVREEVWNVEVRWLERHNKVSVVGSIRSEKVSGLYILWPLS